MSKTETPQPLCPLYFSPAVKCDPRKRDIKLDADIARQVQAQPSTWSDS